MSARARVSAAICALAGAAVLVGSLLAWLELPSPIAFPGTSGPGEATGLDLIEGIVALVSGVVVIVAAALALLTGRRSFGLVALVAAIIAGVAAALVLIDPEGKMVAFIANEAATEELTSENIEALVRGLIQNGSVTVSTATGLILTLAGAAVAALTAVLIVASRAPRRASARVGESMISPAPN